MIATLRTLVTALVLPVLILLSTASRATLRDIPYISIVSVKPQDEQHAVSAFIIVLLAWWWARRRLRAWAPLAAFAASMTAALALEVVQFYIPHRGSQVDDLVPAVQGSAAAVVLAYCLSISCAVVNKARARRTLRG